MARPGRPRNHDPLADEIRFAIRNNDNEKARLLIAKADVDLPDGEGCTPLIWASFYNRTELLQWLIERGADVNHQDRNGYSTTPRRKSMTGSLNYYCYQVHQQSCETGTGTRRSGRRRSTHVATSVSSNCWRTAVRRSTTRIWRAKPCAKWRKFSFRRNCRN
jgi:hypothetical protein